MTDLEDLIVREANRQGCRANQDAIRQAGIDLAGANMTSQGLIHLPSRGCISPGDFVRDLHGRMPNAFSSLADEHKAEPTSNPDRQSVTEQHRQELTAIRKQALPTDWLSKRASVTGLTAEYMDEIRRQRAAKAK